MGVKHQRTSTIIIKNVPDNVKQNDLQSSYENIGSIRQIFITKSKVGNQNIGFVKFTTVEEASQAITSIKQLKGQNIVSNFARKKPRKYRNITVKDEEADLSESDNDATVTKPTIKPPLQKSIVHKTQDGELSLQDLPRNQRTVFVFGLPAEIVEKDVRKKFRKIGSIEKILMKQNVTVVTFLEDSSSQNAVKKLHNHIFKQSLISIVSSLSSDKSIKKLLKPSKIVIRNLSFKISEEVLRDEISKHAYVVEMSLPKADNGRPKGFAFVTLINKFAANKVMQKFNGKEILNRKVAIDWAVNKDQYQKNSEGDTAIASASKPDDNPVDHGDSDDDASDVCAPDDDVGAETSVISEHSDDQEETEAETSNKRSYDDVKEGKTLLLGNLPFDVEKEEIEERFATFGRIRYIRMVYDQEKDRPKGIAFMQFFNKDDAEKCLRAAASNPSSLKGREISVKLVVEKSKLSFGDNKDKKSDNRNLQLAMEGVIKEGTNAAVGVSKTDMMKRKLAFEAKKKKLKSLNHFVSKTRLCVRNMPARVNEVELKKLMSKYGHVIQVKIMRDIKRADSNGIGKSKGYGFVEFSKHEAALTALRNTNNNPNIFTASKRPIVDFSIENSNIVQSRNKRKVAQSQDQNTQKKSFNQRWKDARQKKKEKQSNTGSTNNKQKKVNPMNSAGVEGSNISGANQNSKKRKKSANKQSKAPEKVIKLESDITKVKKLKNEKIKTNKSKKPNKELNNAEEANLRSLINSYKNKLNNSENREKLKRWYED